MTTEEAKIILKVDDEEHRKKFDNAIKRQEELRRKFAEATRAGDREAIAKVAKELGKTSAEISRLQTNAKNIRDAMKRLDQASPKELKNTIKLINQELNSGRVQRGTKEWDDYTAALRRAKEELSSINEEMKGQDSWIDRLKDVLGSGPTALVAGVLGTSSIVEFGKEAVNAFAEMQQEEANVRKFTGMTEAQVKSLNEEFKKMDTRTSREELNKLAQEAGRLGKTSQEDVLGFVRAANQINVALDDLGDGATLELSKLTDIFGDEKRLGTEQALLSVGSVINELSQSCTASAPYLADFSKRLAGVGKQADLTIPQIMGFAAVLDSQGQAVEMSATAFSQLVLKLYKDPAKFAKAAGIDVKTFANTLKKDANEAVLMLLDSLNKMGNMNALAPVFADMKMDGARTSAVLAALAGNVDTVRQRQEEANIAFREGTSITKEYNVQNETVEAGLQKARNGFHELVVQIGEQLEPVMKSAINTGSLFLKVLSGMVTFVMQNKAALLSLTATIGAYAVAVNFATVKVKAHNACLVIATAAKKAWRSAVLLASAAQALFTGNLTRSTAAMRLFGATLKTTPWGLAIAALGALATGLILYTNRLDAAAKSERMMSGLKKDAVKNAQQQVDSITNLVAAAKNEKLSLDERNKAIKQLNKTIPGYNAHLDSTGKKYIANKKALDDYIGSLVKFYEIQGAKDKLSELGRRKADLEAERKEQERARKEIQDEIARSAAYNMPQTSSGPSLPMATMGQIGMSGQLGAVDSKLRSINNELATTKQLEKDILDTYGTEIQKQAVADIAVDGTADDGGGGGGGSKDKKEKKDKKKDQLKKDLEALKSAHAQEQAANLTAYTMGAIDYLDYTEKKKEIDAKYLEDRLALYEKANRTDESEYGQLLLQKAEAMSKAQETEQKKTLDMLKEEYDQRVNFVTEAMFEPDSPVFGNQRAFNQALLEEDVRYLQQKRDLYKQDSPQWVATQKELDDRLAKDRIDKLRETNERMLQYSREYRKQDRAARQKAEIDLLDELHKAGLISEEEYQKAIAKIRKKYRQEDKEDREEDRDNIHSDWADMVQSFAEAIEEIAEGGEELWKNIGKAAEAAASVMCAALQGYTAYANAERDLELAKVEKRYDAEIEAAGKNTKKKELLEKQKEAAIAQVKTKYNERAMKIELAQATAQTAVAAINAYASASKANWILGPIAAALAVAAGGLQIAAIVKQHQAEAAGYYSGGFTLGKNYRKEAGIVHEGEFVANHDAVNNPHLLPLLRIIDAAQRNNTVGSLTADDVSNAIGQGRGVSARGEATLSSAPKTTVVNNAIDTTPIDNLNRLLEQGIEAHMILDGEQGAYKKIKHYERLISNPKR